MRSVPNRMTAFATRWSGDVGIASPLPTECRGSLGGHLLGHESGQFDERLRRRRGWIGGHDGLAGVSTNDYLRIDRNLSEKRYAEHFGCSFSAAVTENLFALSAVTADEVAHVLDDSQNRYIHLTKHGQTLSGIDQRDILRGGHDDGAV